MSKEDTHCLEHDGTFSSIKPVVRYPFAYANPIDYLEDYLLLINVFSYEGSAKDGTWDGRGYPWIEINIEFPGERLIAMRKEYNLDDRPAIFLHGQEWEVIDSWSCYGKISLENHDEHIADLELGKFYCLDTGKILDLSKLKKLAPDK